MTAGGTDTVISPSFIRFVLRRVPRGAEKNP
jgi:hypothetical protein